MSEKPETELEFEQTPERKETLYYLSHVLPQIWKTFPEAVIADAHLRLELRRREDGYEESDPPVVVRILAQIDTEHGPQWAPYELADERKIRMLQLTFTMDVRSKSRIIVKGITAKEQ